MPHILEERSDSGGIHHASRESNVQDSLLERAVERAVESKRIMKAMTQCCKCKCKQPHVTLFGCQMGEN
jgi:hypothetical protein